MGNTSTTVGEAGVFQGRRAMILGIQFSCAYVVRLYNTWFEA